MGDIAGAAIERPALEVGEAEVDKTIEIMRKQRARYEPVERAAQTRRPRHDRFPRHARRRRIPGLERARASRWCWAKAGCCRISRRSVIGMKRGRIEGVRCALSGRLPRQGSGGEDRPVRGHASRQVAAPHLPEVDAEFAKSLGVADGDLAKMRAEIKANLEREVKAKLKSRVQGPGDAGAARCDARIDAPQLAGADGDRAHAGGRAAGAGGARRQGDGATRRCRPTCSSSRRSAASTSG